MSDNLVSFFISVVAGLFTGWLISICVFLYKNYGKYKIAFVSFLNFDRYIRFSISYLFRIKIDGKYLLIKGGRIDQFQPIGGVYKVLNSASDLFRKYQINNDENIPIDNISRDDLRVKVKGKYVLNFLKWFNTRNNREISTHREFYEELIIPNYLEIESLKKFNPEYIKTHTTNISYSNHFKCKELFIYEIYEIRLDNEEKIQILNAIKNHSEKLVLCTMDEIERESIVVNSVSKKIGIHAKHLL